MKRNDKVVSIIDYKISNLYSVKNAVETLGYSGIITSKKIDLLKSDFVILPGVGSFPEAMKQIKKLDLEEIIKELIYNQKPFMGICLGFQMLFDYSDEFQYTKGLGIVEGHVKNLSSLKNLKTIPHVGWNKIKINKKFRHKNFINFDNKHFYFIHSFFASPNNKSLIFSKTIIDDYEFCSSIKNKNLFASQFHPEKSGILGLNMINHFISSNGVK